MLTQTFIFLLKVRKITTVLFIAIKFIFFQYYITRVIIDAVIWLKLEKGKTIKLYRTSKEISVFGMCCRGNLLVDDQNLITKIFHNIESLGKISKLQKYGKYLNHFYKSYSIILTIN